MTNANQREIVSLQNGDTPLHIASAMGRRKLARILLESAPDLDALNQQAETSLRIAERKGHAEIMEIIKVSFEDDSKKGFSPSSNFSVI